MVYEKLSTLKILNQLNLDEGEETRITGWFSFAEENRKAMADVDTENVLRMVHPVPIKNQLREDIKEKLFQREDLLKGAPETTDGYWQVPRLME